MSYEELRARQDPPFVTLPLGAAGIVCAFLRAGLQGPRPLAHLDAAARWLYLARREVPHRSSLYTRSLPRATLKWSFYYSTSAVHHLSALVAHARGDARQRDVHLGVFSANARRSRGGPAEFFDGTAGHLTAATIASRRTGAGDALEVADELALDLLARGARRSPSAWTRARRTGFAHGRAGVFHALLGWSIAAERELPRWFASRLDELGEEVEATGGVGAPTTSSVLERSWCTGAAGQALLWTRAYERFGRADYRRLALRCARLVTTEIDGCVGDLCCGLGGRAYACLSVLRIDPEGGWRTWAATLAMRGANAMLDDSGRWPNGLYKGFPGVVCLILDLFRPSGDRLGFPLVEG